MARIQEENRAEEKETKVAKARKARVQLRTQLSHPTVQGSVLSTRLWPLTRTSNILRGQMICYDFQSGRCANTPCNKVHVCIGCGIYGKAYNSCGCLESKAA